jgi:hypothetical protein
VIRLADERGSSLIHPFSVSRGHAPILRRGDRMSRSQRTDTSNRGGSYHAAAVGWQLATQGTDPWVTPLHQEAATKISN